MLLNLELLSHQDDQSLLEFERVNQSWFESYVPPRETGFYTESGMTQHISECLDLHERDEMLPMLIKDDIGHIIGRINLHSIDLDERTAHLGYRIAKNAIGNGVATTASRKVIELCKGYFQLESLIALAATDNIASQRVLTNNGFVKTRTHTNYTRLKGVLIHCIEYQKIIAY
ncbi:GNAT family N-acetyltransferase [Vibrio lamellibrachiae]|uniref:GNAT family N-acetyltransferase n=1 Tax=Vibrio lamellibrachiae TaxID=2910253 RepID=UPI003D0A3C39